MLRLALASRPNRLVTIETVTVGDAGNAADSSTGYGAVANVFAIGKYEVTIGQYATFLNAVDPGGTNPNGIYNSEMATNLNIAGISFTAAAAVGSKYSVMNNGGSSSNRPITFVSWFDAARFANWMNNGATVGASTETGAYTLNGATSGIFTVNPGATWFLPSEDQWYKAAYYKGGGTNAGYWLYPTKSDTAPGNTIGGETNQANYYAGDYAVTQSGVIDPNQNYLTAAGAFSNSASAYGTFDQGGNVFELNDAVIDYVWRGIRGGYWDYDDGGLQSSVRSKYPAFYKDSSVGFRVATVLPGPSLTTSTGNITSTTTTLRGEVVSEGNSPVTARGFVYALASVSDPKIGDAGVTQVAVSGSGLGSYSQLLSGLTPNTAYVFRAYVVNGEGTTYSSAQNFSTNLPPVIISHGGNTTVSLNVAENSTAVSTVSATDADAGQTITYSISGGADAARFAIGSTSGVVTFAAAPDFEAPADVDANNVYTVIVQATDNGNTPKSATQTLTVTVTNVLDNGILAVEQPAGTPLASGNGSVGFGNLTIGQSNERTFTLSSQGEAALFLPSGVVISGAAASDFSLVGSVAASLATGDNTTFTVRFSPTASGNRSATLSIPTNDTRPGRSPYTITLTGNGSATPTVATYTSAASQVLGGWVNGENFTIGTVGTTSNATNWPAAESPDKVVDANTGTKFLIHRNSHAGVILKPTNSSLVFNRLSLSTANDASERDPASFILYGSSSNLTGNASTNIPISSLTQIASGNVTMLSDRNAGPTVIQFANSVAYTSYVVVFPTVRSTVSNNLMQISEIQLSQGATPPLAVAMADARGGQLSGSNFSFGSIGASAPGTNWLAGESPDHAMDGNVNTKFAIFRSTGAGLLASPQAGTAPVNTLTLWTANDSPERDPATYQVYGFPTRITQTSGTLAVGNGTLLANGTVTLPADRNSGPVQVDFNNSTAYASYLVVFPTVKNSPTSTNLMQVSEVQFSYNGIPDFSLPLTSVSLNENSGSQTRATFASSITAGLGDVDQTVSFNCTNNNNALFSAQPAISANGTLTFTTAPDAYGNATVSVVATDNFGRSSAPKTFRVQVAIVPSISRSADSLGNFTASAAQSFTVNGRGLSGPVTLTAPTGFEISTDNSTFSSTLEVNKPGTIQSVYRGAFGDYTTASGKIWSAGSGGEFPNRSVFAAITSNGSVVTWGNADSGGNSTILTGGNLSSNVKAVYSNQNAFAALKDNGSVVTWGYAGYGGNSTILTGGSLTSNVTAVYSNQGAFAALKADGSVVTWGGVEYGGNSTNVTGGNLSSNVTAVYSNQFAFAALKDNGSVVTWGDSSYGGNSTIWNGGNIYTSVAGSLTSNVTAVYSNGGAFAVLKDNGSVVTWGQAASGGNSTILTGGNLTSNVKAVYSTGFAFAALKDNGSVVTWGDSTLGGNSTVWDGVNSFTSVSGSLTSNVTAVYSNAGAFAALKDNGSVVTWGDATCGGNSTIWNGGNSHTSVASSLTSNVKAVYSNQNAFAALKDNGSVVTWGYAGYGGNSTNVTGSLTSNVTAVYSNGFAFAALKTDGSVVTWGDADYGGNSTILTGGNLTSGVKAVYSTERAFAALKTDGSVVTWGVAFYGGTGGPANIGAGFPIPATIYTRLSSTAPAGSVSGNLTLTSSGVGNQTVALSGFVNGIPDFSLPLTSVSLNENSGAQSNAAFATGITAGLGDVDQTVSFACTNNNNALFSAQPAISANGTLTFTTASDAYGNATVSVVATDNLGRGSAPKTFRVQVAVVPSISRSADSLGNFNAATGNASAAQSFTVNGRGLSGPVTLTAPTGFEISTDNSTFSSTLEVNKAGTIQSVYRGAFGNYTTASGKIWSAGSGGEFPNDSAFAAITSNGSIVTWGNADSGGNSTILTGGNLTSDVKAVYSNPWAFAALKTDGSVVTWGDATYGGNSTILTGGNLSINVTAVYSTYYAFAALKTDGSVVTWGDASNGGNSTILTGGSLTSNVTAVYSTLYAFAALKDNGTVVTWGDARYGGNSASVAGNLTSNVTAVYSNGGAFAALKDNGSVVTWGDFSYGGNSASVAGNLTSNVTAVYSNTDTLYSNGGAFAALKADGSVVTWGNYLFGGNSASVAGNLTSGVTAVYSNSGAFAALKADGSVVNWGSSLFGGNSRNPSGGNFTSGVTAVYSTLGAFAALKDNGSVVTWGDSTLGGNSTNVAASLTSNVTAVYSNGGAFAALKADGSVVTWGDAGTGGNSTIWDGGNNYTSVASSLSSNVTAVYSTGSAFAALKTDGSVVTWGDATRGGSGGPANIGAGFPIPSTIYTRLSSTAPAGSVSGNLTLTSSGVGNQTVALSGTVSSAANPAITVSTASLNNFTAKLGSASSATAFLVGGSDLTANLTISAPTGFEISSTGSAPFASSLNLAPASGTVASTSVYARLAATAAAGVNSGNITLASTGATSQQVVVSGTVTLPYEDWVAYWNTQTGSFSGATALGSADPDSDGYSNTTEFAFQGDPLSPTASLITVAPAGGNITVTFLARVGNGTIWTGGNATGHGLDYQIQSTGNLTLGFGTASDVLNITPAANQTGIQAVDFPYVRWQFQAPISGDRKFYRVRALPQGDQ